MKDYWIKLKEWWNNLGAREKKMLIIGGSIVLIALVYFWIWSPLLDKINNQRNHIQTDEKLLAWMKAADKQIQQVAGQTKNKATVLSPVALLSYVQSKVKQANLASYLTQLKQVTNETIALRFQKVEFDRLITLLTSIVKEQNVSIIQLSVVSDNTAGVVTSDVVIKLGG